MNYACKSLNFIIKMRALLRKIIARFFLFMVSLIDLLKRLFRLLWLDFLLNLHCWTLNHQCAYVECELKKMKASINNDHLLSFRRRLQQFGLYYSAKNFVEEFKCETFPNIAGERIEAERPTATQNVWWIGSWKVGRRTTSLSKNCVQWRS